MQVVPFSGEVTTAPFDLVVLGVFQGEAPRLAAFKAFDKALGGALKSAIEDEDWKGKAKQKLVLNTLGKLRQKRVALVGMGRRGEQTALAVVHLAGAAARLGRDVKAKDVLVVLPEVDGDAQAELELAARGAHLGTYAFTRYKSEASKKHEVKKLALSLGDKAVPASAKEALHRGEVVAEAVALARDLVNEPGVEIYPESLAKKATEVARAAGLKVKVFEPAELKKMGMNLLLAVGAGSVRPPRFVHLTYTPPGKPKEAAPVVLVGKGITFDSGGLSLKGAANMEDMKVDMSGSAAVLATMLAISKLKPKVHVHALMALAENMPSGHAIRPGDVFKSAAGKTVEINNTDAEGRLVLADALNYALGLSPRYIIDLATLTGACIVALGTHTSGLFSNDDTLADKLLGSSKKAGEHLWRMPLTPQLKEQLKSDVADMKNTGAREGGAITAALFLSEFVGETAWAHLDIAGPATTKSDSGADSKGATGVGVATLVDFLVH